MDAIQYLLHLHSCEQEGISSGMPTPQQWIDAVEAAWEEYNKLSEHSALKEQWISVETLPEQEGEYIVLTDSGNIKTTFYDKTENKWAYLLEVPLLVTHWMPLPQPPKP